MNATSADGAAAAQPTLSSDAPTAAVTDATGGTADQTPPTELQAAYEAMIERGGTPLNPAPEFDGGDMSEPPMKKTKRKRRWPWIVFPILAVLIAVGVVGGIFASQAMAVKDDLMAAKGKVSKVMGLIKKGDTEQLQKTADEILVLTTSANETVSNPLWETAAHVPFVGANIVAVQETTKATHILVRDAMPPALELLGTIDVKNLKMEGGGFNLQPFRDAQSMLPELSAVFVDAKTHVDKIDRDAILPLVEENIGQLVDIVDQATPAIELAEKYLPNFLTLLGGDGPRNYALLFQNNAEIRATGGNPGTASIMNVDNGKIEMREDWETASYSTIGHDGTGMDAIQPEEKNALFEPDTIQYVQNFTRFPDFRDTGVAVQTLWEKSTDSSLDGVISMDPVVLASMLKITGPVTVPGEDTPITSENAVTHLLSETYERFGSDGRAADEYFNRAAVAIFDKVSAGDWDPTKMITVLMDSIAEQRIYMWFPDPAMQEMAVEFGTQGDITSDNSKVVQTGIYLNDTSHSKMEYYLSTSMNVQCNAEARTMTTSITMGNSAPSADLSDYTLGVRSNSLGFPRVDILLEVMGMAVPGGELVSTDPENGDLSGWDRYGAYNGREATSLFIAIQPGEERTVSFTSTVPADATTPVVARFSPTVTDTPVTIEDSCVSMFPGTVQPQK